MIPTGCYRGMKPDDMEPDDMEPDDRESDDMKPDDMEFRVWRYRSCIAAGDCSITQEASLVVIIVITNLFLLLLAL